MSFEVLKEAYDTLSDADRRATYDMSLKDVFAHGRDSSSMARRRAEDFRSAKSIQEAAVEMKTRYEKNSGGNKEAMPMWYVGQQAPSQHQVYYYKQSVAAERAFDRYARPYCSQFSRSDLSLSLSLSTSPYSWTNLLIYALQYARKTVDAA